MSSKDIFIRFFLIACFFFSIFLMFHTFSYANGRIFAAAKIWSDFASQLPLIRSFSYGFNYPVEYPIFSGEPIHYHFLFYFFVGMLEKIGLPLHFALNAPAAIGFFLLLFMLYLFAKLVFSSRAVGILTILFFLLNGSLSFVYFFQENPLSLSTPISIFQNTEFSSFAPYFGEGVVSAFWNLNIYTNQRHLAAAFALSLFIIATILAPVFRREGSGIVKSILLGILLGSSFYFHIAVFMMTGAVILFLGIFFSKIRNAAIVILIIAGLIALPQYLYMNSGGEAFSAVFQPGYLISNNLNIQNFISYWFMNLGLHFILIPLGFIFASKAQKKIFLAFFSLFLVGNLFQFSPEMAANHKFFNYFLLIGSMFSAFILVKLWKKIFLRPLVIICCFFLVLSGIIDLFPILNDRKIDLLDYPRNQDISWVMKNTPRDAVFLNTTFLFSPESLAGRKIFLGWPYFSWSAGYDTDTRGQKRTMMLSAENKEKLCTMLHKNNISYIEINTDESGKNDQPEISSIFADEFSIEYKNGPIEFYNVKKNCN